MSREKELLKKILATRWLDHELSCEVEELLAQPEQDQPKCCVICGTTENVKWVGGHQPYRCGSRNCVPF